MLTKLRDANAEEVVCFVSIRTLRLEVPLEHPLGKHPRLQTYEVTNDISLG